MSFICRNVQFFCLNFLVLESAGVMLSYSSSASRSTFSNVKLLGNREAIGFENSSVSSNFSGFCNPTTLPPRYSGDCYPQATTIFSKFMLRKFLFTPQINSLLRLPLGSFLEIVSVADWCGERNALWSFVMIYETRKIYWHFAKPFWDSWFNSFIHTKAVNNSIFVTDAFFLAPINWLSKDQLCETALSINFHWGDWTPSKGIEER